MAFEHNSLRGLHDTASETAHATDATDLDFIPFLYAHGLNSLWPEEAPAGGGSNLAKETTPESGSARGLELTGDGNSQPGTGNGVRSSGRTSGAKPGPSLNGSNGAGLSSQVPDTSVLQTESGLATSAAGATLLSEAAAAPQPGVQATATQPFTHTSPLATSPQLLGAGGVPIDRQVLTTAELTTRYYARRKLNLRLLIGLLSLLLVLMTVLYSPLFDPVASQPLRVPDTVPYSEVQPYGVNTFLYKEVELWKKEKTLSLASDMGAGWIRQQFPWAEIEYRADPANPFYDVKNNQPSWTKFDGIVDMAQKHNLRVIARIDNAPVWSHPGSNTLKSPPDKAHLADFGAFISTFVKRYKGKVDAIQVWNEPNLTGEWAVPDPKNPTKSLPVSPQDYTEMLKVAYTAAKSADPNMLVLAAPLATTNETKSNLDELDFLQRMYAAGAQHYFDVMSANAYGKSEAPEADPSPGKLNFRRVELLHDVMVKNGDSNKAVWFNEYGWNDSPASIKNLPWGRVTPEQQSDYTVRGIEYARKNWPWAGVFTIWYLRQVGDISDTNSEYYFGMVNPDFVVSPLYKAVAAAAQNTEKVAMPGTWGPLSPPVEAGASWRMKLNPAAPGGMAVAPSSISSTLDVRFTGTDLKMLLVPVTNTVPLTDTAVSSRYYVTVDNRTESISSDLPRDSHGRAYIDVKGITEPTEVNVVSGLGSSLRTQQHTLQVSVGGAEGSGVKVPRGGALYAPTEEHVDLPAIAAVTVEVHSSYLLFATLALLLLAGIAFSVWALSRTGSGNTLARRR